MRKIILNKEASCKLFLSFFDSKLDDTCYGSRFFSGKHTFVHIMGVSLYEFEIGRLDHLDESPCVFRMSFENANSRNKMAGCGGRGGFAGAAGEGD